MEPGNKLYMYNYMYNYMTAPAADCRLAALVCNLTIIPVQGLLMNSIVLQGVKYNLFAEDRREPGSAHLSIVVWSGRPAIFIGDTPAGDAPLFITAVDRSAQTG